MPHQFFKKFLAKIAWARLGAHRRDARYIMFPWACIIDFWIYESCFQHYSVLFHQPELILLKAGFASHFRWFRTTVSFCLCSLVWLQDTEVLQAWLASLHLEENCRLFVEAGYDMPTISRMMPEVSGLLQRSIARRYALFHVRHSYRGSSCILMWFLESCSLRESLCLGESDHDNSSTRSICGLEFPTRFRLFRLY